MAVCFHYHRFPSCGTTHNTACSTACPNTPDICFGPLGPRNPHAGEYACLHSDRATTTDELFALFDENARSWFTDAGSAESEKFVVEGTRARE